MARVERFHTVGDAVFVDARLDHLHGKFRLMIAVAQNQERLVGKLRS